MEAAFSDTGRQGTGDVAVLALGNLVLNLDNFGVAVGERAVLLTFKEFELLRVLALQPNRIIPFETLTRSLWASSGRRDTRRLNVLVYKLRNKLSDSMYRIEIVRGRGYGLLSSTRSSAEVTRGNRAVIGA